MLQWTWECRCFFKFVFLFSLDKYPEAELLVHMLVLFLILGGTSIVFHSGWTNLYSHQQCTEVPFFPHLHQNFSFVCSLVLMIAILTDGRWYLLAVVISIFLMISYVEHLLMYLLAILGKKGLFRSFIHFSIGLCLPLNCMCFIYILDINLLMDICFANIFLSHRLLFHAVDIFLYWAEAFSLKYSYLFIFVFVAFAIWCPI